MAALEKEAAAGPLRDSLTRYCVTILALTAEVDAENMKGRLPEIASSLANYNYQAYKEMNGTELPSPVKGASLETLYTFSQQQERQLRDAPASTSSNNSSGTSSNGTGSSQMHARAPGGFGRGSAADMGGRSQFTSMAQAIMARTKLRMMALQGQQNVAAGQLLDEFLYHMHSREERCNVLPEAMTPPGITTAKSGDDMVHTVPSDLIQVIDEKLAGLSSTQQADGIEQLPSGELLATVLQELKEDVQEYDKHIFSRLSPLEQMGDFREVLKGGPGS